MVARIVVAYDDSAGARLALAKAVELVRALGTATATLLAVAVDESGNDDRMSYIGHSDGDDAIGDAKPHAHAHAHSHSHSHSLGPGHPECRAWLDEASQYARKHGVPIKTEIRVGLPSGQLLAAARAANADLLIVGHSKHPAMRNRVVGSTAERIARHSFCSVLIAR
jgi:nucleotide-binding universal stress UspA family protein